MVRQFPDAGKPSKKKTQESKTAANKIGAGRGLPVELIEKILTCCSRGDLLKCCIVSKSLYQLILPLIYRTYNPTIWPDVIRLERQLLRGMGPKCFDGKEIAANIASKIRAIDLRLGKSPTSYREQEWALQETTRSLSRILSRTQNLRSFSWHSEGFFEDMSALWKALRTCKVEELVLSDRWPQPNASLYGPQSKLWTLSNLSKLHLTLLWAPTHPPCYLVPGLIKLLQKTPNLIDLKLNLQGVPEIDLPVGQITSEKLFKSDALLNLRYLDLENIFCSDEKKTVQFLASLTKLEKIRWVREHVRGEHDLFHGSKREYPKTAESSAPILPALKEVDVTDLGLLRFILLHGKPVVLRNVLMTCSSGSPESRLPADLSFLQQCTSIEELHLSVYGYAHIEEYRAATVKCLLSIPTSVRRLAVRMPSHLAHLKLTHPLPSMDYGEALRRLNNLEYLILPWTTILYKTDKQIGSHPDELTQVVESRAKFIARKAAERIPSLRYVFFQGSHSLDATGDSSWKPNFDESDKEDRRFCVMITRELKKDMPIIKKGFLKKTSASGGTKGDSTEAKKSVREDGNKSIVDGTESSGSKSMSNAKKPSVKVELILSSCVCPNCWLDEKVESVTSRRHDSMEFMLESMMPMMSFEAFPFAM